MPPGSKCLKRPEDGVGPCGAAAAGSCRGPDVALGNIPVILCKGSKHT